MMRAMTTAAINSAGQTETITVSSTPAVCP